MRLLSDSKLDAARAFGLAFQVTPETVEQYKRFDIDLEAASGGETHHWLPVPAAYLLDASLEVVFSYVHPDYRVRVPPAVVLAAARTALED